MTTKETGSELGRDTRMCGDPKSWFPMRVTYQREMKVKAELDRLEIENFVPMRYKVVESQNAYVYVDWADPTMQHPTNRSTAEKLKEKIKRYDKFVFIASDAALDSKWCNWEIGFGDAHKFEQDKIAIFPIKQDNRQWSGNEYLQLYPSIEYFDGTTTYKNGEIIPKGYYVYYHYLHQITPLVEWISK